MTRATRGDRPSVGRRIVVGGVLAVMVFVAVCALADAFSPSASARASVACEQFIQRRLGVSVEFRRDSGESALPISAGRWQSRESYVEPLTGRIVRYACTVEQVTDTPGVDWRLVEISTNR